MRSESGFTDVTFLLSQSRARRVSSEIQRRSPKALSHSLQKSGTFFFSYAASFVVATGEKVLVANLGAEAWLTSNQRGGEWQG